MNYWGGGGGLKLVLCAQPHPQFLKWYKTFSWLFGSHDNLLIGCRTLYLGSFYRPPNRKPEIEKAYLEAFNQSLTRIMTKKNAHVLVGGDFNCGNIEWSTM